MPKRLEHFWLTRDADFNGMLYNASVIEPDRERDFCRDEWTTDGLQTICAAVFHTLTDIRLDPGGGPIRVKLVIAE